MILERSSSFLAGKTEKSGTVGVFGKTGSVDTICILLEDVDPTAEKLYRSDLGKAVSFGSGKAVSFGIPSSSITYSFK